MIPTFWEEAMVMGVCLLIAGVLAYLNHLQRRAMWDPIFDALRGPSPAMKALIEAERRHRAAVTAALGPSQPGA